MHSLFNRTLDYTAELCGVTPEQVLSGSRAKPLPEARQMVAFLLAGKMPKPVLCALMGMKAERLRAIFRAAQASKKSSLWFRQSLIEIEENTIEMNIKISNSLLQSLHAAVTVYLMEKPLAMADQLIYEHMDDINEKLRSKVRAGQKNLSLNSKQQKAFVIWFQQKGNALASNTSNLHSQIAMNTIVEQVKPIDRQESKALLKSSSAIGLAILAAGTELEFSWLPVIFWAVVGAVVMVILLALGMSIAFRPDDLVHDQESPEGEECSKDNCNNRKNCFYPMCIPNGK